MKKLLILDKHPFGRLTDSYKWCQYLREDFKVTLICLDDSVRKELDGVRIVRVSTRFNKKIRGARYIITCLWHILFSRGPIFVVYFEHCDLLKRFFKKKKMHVDIRTMAVWGDQPTRDRFDNRMREACLKYDSVSVISEGVKKRLQLDNAWILPLGADVISNEKKQYFPLRLLYVGTFDDRRIEDTLYGLRLFIDKHPDIDIHYDIIGDGHHGEEKDCESLSNTIGISRYVKFHGRIDNSMLTPYFDKANVGISYVPITSYFDIQPPTKTFEYVLSGIFTIATGTQENIKIINEKNGVLIQDTPDAFCDALSFYVNHYEFLKEEVIRESLREYNWKTIVKDILAPHISKD